MADTSPVKELLDTTLFAASKAKQQSVNKVAPTTLTPPRNDRGARAIANSFSPPANIALLSRPAASVLLTEQAGKPPKILERSKTFETFARFTKPPENVLASSSERGFVDRSGSGGRAESPFKSFFQPVLTVQGNSNSGRIGGGGGNSSSSSSTGGGVDFSV